MEIIKLNIFNIVIIIANIVLLLLYIYDSRKLKNINSKYQEFMKKIGNGNNIDEMLQKYLQKIEDTEKSNYEMIEYCKNVDKNISQCIKKIGLVRYNAFKDTGGDLSFALALLDEKNNGIVLNGIYSREMSNIYAKLIKKGISQSTLSEEEQEAIQQAIEKSET